MLKQLLVERLTRDNLKDLVSERPEYNYVDRRSRVAMKEVVLTCAAIHTSMLLEYLSEWEVKEVCEARGISSKGRRGALISRLLAHGDGAGERTSSEPNDETEEYELSDVELEFLAEVPDDGTTIGNMRLRQILGWSETKYRRIREQLIDSGILVAGRGRGGSVYRDLSMTIDDTEPSVDPEDIAGSGRRTRRNERDLYVGVVKTLKENWSQIFPGFPRPMKLWIDSTPHMGSRATGGRWTRPDASAVTINRYKYVPGTHLDVFTFEVKPSDQLNVLGVYEALAHSRRANFAYALYEVARADEDTSPILAEIEREATRLGIGAAVFERPDDFDTWQVLCPPSRFNTEARALNEFMELLPAEIRDDILLAIR